MDKPKRPTGAYNAAAWDWHDYADAMDAWLRDEVLSVLKTVVHQWKYYHLRATGNKIKTARSAGCLSKMLTTSSPNWKTPMANTEVHGNMSNVRGGYDG
jgi:hypothetical protein